MADRVTDLSRRTVLRLDEHVMRAARLMARLEGVSVATLIEVLLFDFAHRDVVGEPLGDRPAPARSPLRPPGGRQPAPVLPLDAARARRPADAARGLLTRCELVRQRAAQLRERAKATFRRAAAARQAAEAARARWRRVVAGDRCRPFTLHGA